MIREFASRHMKSEKVKIEEDVSHLVWERGIRHPPRKIRVKLTKDDDDNIIVSKYQEEKKVEEKPKEKKEEKKVEKKPKEKKEEKKVEEKKEEKKVEEKKEEKKVEEKKEEKKVEEKKEEKKVEEKKEEKKVEEKKEEKKVSGSKSDKKQKERFYSNCSRSRSIFRLESGSSQSRTLCFGMKPRGSYLSKHVSPSIDVSKTTLERSPVVIDKLTRVLSSPNIPLIAFTIEFKTPTGTLFPPTT